VFHDSLKAVLLVNAGLGSASSPAASTRTILWRWTGREWVVQDSLGPPIRNLAGVAYDARRNALVMHGGSYSLDLVYDETWEWSPSTRWVRKSGSGPGARDHVQMAYDAERQRIVLFGGQLGTTSFPGDTWAWDGQAWQRAAANGPSGRVHYALVYDPVRRGVLLFGGLNPAAGDLGDTWLWTGASWGSAATAATPRTHASLGVSSRGVVLFGGFPSSPTMMLENGTWRADPQPNTPSARYLTAMAFDPLRKVTVLFGGGDPSSNMLYSDTWEYDATSGWRRMSDP
jgi:hypothetical protein